MSNLLEKIYLIGLVLSLNSNIYSESKFSYLEKMSFQFGNNMVYLSKIYVAGKSKLTYINVHENEWSSITAVKRKITKSGGTFYLINHEKTRRIRAEHSSFDPNRIFTKIGREYHVNKKDEMNVGDFSNSFLKTIFCGIKNVVAVHNNTNNRYSIKSYLSGGKYEINANKVNYNPNLDPDDFFYTTSNNLYKYLKNKKYNVVLQSDKVIDDGSLSVYCSKKNIGYVNVESEFGHTKIQEKMLDIASDYINKKGL